MKCREFLNADLIAAGLSPFAPATQNMRAGRLILEARARARQSPTGFRVRDNPGRRMRVKLLADLKKWGYRIDLLFLWLRGADMAVRRVTERISEGGPKVAEDVIKRRYNSGLKNFFQLYGPQVDSWWLYDSSRLPASLIARTENGTLSAIDGDLLVRIRNASEEAPVSNNPGDSLREKADAALLQAAAKVVARARRHGTHIVVWENGKIADHMGRNGPCAWQHAELQITCREPPLTTFAFARSSSRRSVPGSRIHTRPPTSASSISQSLGKPNVTRSSTAPRLPKHARPRHGSSHPRSRLRRHSSPARAAMKSGSQQKSHRPDLYRGGRASRKCVLLETPGIAVCLR